ncbi:MAG TPA: hypothetical protein VKH37_13255, partial [Ferruginibacter sp.]|nr:hypothetical protein [Ferruginibacter sp.]
QKVDDFNDNYMSLATVLMGPYFALGLLLFFRKRQRNFAEISIAFILFTAFVTVIEILWVTPFRLLVHNQTVLNVSVLVDLILQTVYISWGLGQFFNYRTFAGYLKVFGVTLLIGSIGLVVVYILLWNYIYQGHYGDIMRYVGN